MSSSSASGRVVFEAQLEAQGSRAAAALPSLAAFPSLTLATSSEALERLVEAEKRAHKAMLLRIFDCIEALLNQATKAMLLATTAALRPVLPASLINFPVLSPALRLLPFRKPLPRRRGRPLGTETVLSLEEIEKAYLTCARERETPPKRHEVAKQLLVSDSTLSRRLADKGLSFRCWVQLARLDLLTIY